MRTTSRRIAVPPVIALVVLAASMVGVAGATADIGIPGPSYAGAYIEPSGSKPQSKLWYHAGAWFGVLFHQPSATFRIHRFDPSSGAWADTGTVVDTRINSRTDARLVGDKLYVASHRYSKTAESGSYPARLLRYSYHTAGRRWIVDSGFPTTINTVKSEALVIDVDSTGCVWATWTHGGRVWVNRTVGDDRTWGTPYVLPTSTSLQSDDIASVVAFGGNSVGVLWGDQNLGSYLFSVHADGAPDDAWSVPEVALGGTNMSDDHLNVKAASDGRLFAAVKTSRTADPDPLIVLAVRAPGGGWTASTVATERYSHTRPVVALDEVNRQVTVLMTGPQAPSTVGQKGGDIFAKTASMDDPVFPDGYGTVVMHSSTSADMNNVTTTKQSVTPETGLLAVATTQTIERYWSAHLPVEGGVTPPPPPPAPITSFSASPLSGPAPLSVTFTDTSTNAPTSWSWSFGDGHTSTAQHPQHTYANAGTYAVSLTASNAGGSSTATATVTSESPPLPPPGSTLRVPTSADAYVSSSSPGTNAGTSSFLRVGTGTATYRSFIRFEVPASAASVAAVTLRLHAASNTADGGAIALVGDAWTETSVNWSNAPAIGAVIAPVGKIVSGTWVEIDVTAAIRGPGTYNLAITGGSTTSAWFSSRQGANPPELVVSTG